METAEARVRDLEAALEEARIELHRGHRGGPSAPAEAKTGEPVDEWKCPECEKNEHRECGGCSCDCNPTIARLQKELEEARDGTAGSGKASAPGDGLSEYRRGLEDAASVAQRRAERSRASTDVYEQDYAGACADSIEESIRALASAPAPGDPRGTAPDAGAPRGLSETMREAYGDPLEAQLDEMRRQRDEALAALRQNPRVQREDLNAARTRIAELRSLKTELWEGIREHGLTAPPEGKGSEASRIIHAYGAGVVGARERIAELERERDALAERLRVAERVARLTDRNIGPELSPACTTVIGSHRIDECMSCALSAWRASAGRDGK